MFYNKILDYVFSSRSNIKVLRAIINYSLGTSGREIARLSGLSPKTCLSTLTSLENTGIVNRIRGGRDHLFSLNRNHFLVKEVIIPALNSERDYLESLRNEIKRKLFKKCAGAYVFGSIARNEENLHSDFDLCIIINNNISKKILIENVNNLKINSYLKYGITISPFYITKQEFIKRAKNNKSPVNDILKDGILLFGKIKGI